MATGFTWIGAIAVIVILFAAFQVWGTSLLEHHTQTDLAVQFNKDTAAIPSDDRPYGLIPATTPVVRQPAGSVIARIRIPAIAVNQYVVEGATTGDLEKGPGHYTGTAVPGQAGNVAIAAHRTTFGAPFGRLDELRPGELILLTTTAGEKLGYSVFQTPRLVSPTDKAFLDDFGDNRLTLTTSNPKYSAVQRLVIVARLVEPSANAITTPVPPTGPPPGPVPAAQTTGWNLPQLPLALLIAALLVLLALAYRRPSKDRRLLTILILGPVWIAGLYLLFQALTNVLPATL
jgi:sortase A